MLVSFYMIFYKDVFLFRTAPQKNKLTQALRREDEAQLGYVKQLGWLP
jgi:hypothetical protein